MKLRNTVYSLAVLFFFNLFVSVASSYAGYVSWSSWCRRGDGAECSASDVRDHQNKKQIVVFPVGFKQSEYGLFVEQYNRLISQMSFAGRDVYSAKYKNQILYFASWTPSIEINSEGALFSARILDNPMRGKALSVDQGAVLNAVDTLRSRVVPWLQPWAVLIIFNSPESDITANASPPTQLRKPYGIARITRGQLNSPYIASHELAHAGLNFLDEYIEPGLESMSIRSLDILTPLAIWQTASDFGDAMRNLFGIYQYSISEILSANGNENMDVSRYVSRVTTHGFAKEEFINEGGMFFGRGTFHHAGPNLMGGSSPGQSRDDGFSYDHNAPQKRAIRMTFEDARAERPNNRLRNAGPVNDWIRMGGRVTLLLFDADKNHHQQPTKSYDVQVGWYDRKWKVCRAAFIPYPCFKKEWKTVQKTVEPTERYIDLKGSTLYGLASFVVRVACKLGVGEIPYGDKKVDICAMPLEDTVDAFLPTLNFSVPYQQVKMPTSQWATKYYWRFRTDNGFVKSGWTQWGYFSRSL